MTTMEEQVKSIMGGLMLQIAQLQTLNQAQAEEIESLKKQLPPKAEG